MSNEVLPYLIPSGVRIARPAAEYATFEAAVEQPRASRSVVAICLTALLGAFAVGIAMPGCGAQSSRHIAHPAPSAYHGTITTLVKRQATESDRVAETIYGAPFPALSLHRRHQVSAYVKCISEAYGDPSAAACVDRWFR
jgi:hypothetical protein